LDNCITGKQDAAGNCHSPEGTDMTTLKQHRHSHIKRGQGVFQCRCCKRNSRDTGDNGDLQLCPQCYDLAGEENSLSDSGEFYQGPAWVLDTIAEVALKGGNASCWDDLREAALKALPAATPAPAIGKVAPVVAPAAPVAGPQLTTADYQTVNAQVAALYEPAVAFIGRIQSRTNRAHFANVLEKARVNANDTVFTDRAVPAAEWGTVFKDTIQLHLDTDGFPGTVAQHNLTVRYLTEYFRKVGLVK
jgi:hypothetical protein